MRARAAWRLTGRRLLACALIALAVAACGRAGSPVRRQPAQSPAPPVRRQPAQSPAAQSVIQEPEEETEEKQP